MKKFLVVLAILGVNAQAGSFITYIHPKVGGIALDWCKTWAHNCGKPAADYFCRVKGHRWAVSYAMDQDIGYTKILKTGQICNAPFCDSFKYIRCRRKAPVLLPKVKRFKWPKVGGIALDWCYTYAHGCGYKAANEFCKTRGYWKGVKSYAKENNVGYTKILRTGQICHNAGCDTFKYIDCKK
jgi:hypothetical protein